MKIAVMGAGGVGGFYGGRMARAGADVTFIARGPHLEALRNSGLRVESPTAGNFAVAPVKATQDPGEVGPVDVLWMTVKAYDLEGAAEAVRPMVGPETVVIPLLNGVDIAARIGRVLGQEHLMGGVVFVSAAIAAPGLIRHTTMDRLLFGELAGGLSPRGERIKEMLHGAGIEAALSPDIRKEIWAKFMFLNAVAGVATVTRCPLGPARENPASRPLFLACLREGAAVAAAQGVALESDAPEKALAFIDTLPPETKPSLLLDLERGRPLELDALQGTVVRLGRELGVAVPVNEFLLAALSPHAQGNP